MKAQPVSHSANIREALRVVQTEAQGLARLSDAFGPGGDLAPAFDRAVGTIAGLERHLIVVGVGKSGHIGQKLAASFASTGTPSFFMHPTEASHGDLGMVVPGCAVLAISNSGQSTELVDVLRYCRRTHVPVIGITRDPASGLGRSSDIVLRLPHAEEACRDGLVPTTSTTVTLVLGDALVMAVMAHKGITPTDFGYRHPGGKLGRSLHTVADWMVDNAHTPPTIAQDAPISDVVLAISEGQNGCIAVLDDAGHLAGMITDGDIRRAMGPDIFSQSAADIMTRTPVTFVESDRMRDVVERLSAQKLGNAFVVRDNTPVAVLNIKTLVTQGYV